MIQVNLWKKLNLALAVLTSVLVFSCKEQELTVPNSSTAESDSKVSTQATVNQPVRLLRGSASSHYIYHGAASYSRKFEVRVQNLAYTKKVFIHHKKKDGSWTDIQASYAGTLDSGYELWRANYAYTDDYENPEDPLANQFVVGYTVNGTTYWDNNSGANYTLNYNDGVLLGKGYNVMTYNSKIASGTSKVDIDIRNIGSSKIVQVIYTTNNWATTKIANASFVSHYYISGYLNAAYIHSPNALGIERWVGSLSVGSATSVKYFIKYQVNGQTILDRNFGKDYTATVQ